MGQAVPVRTDYSAGEFRRLGKQAKDAGQARRLLAIAAIVSISELRDDPVGQVLGDLIASPCCPPPAVVCDGGAYRRDIVDRLDQQTDLADHVRTWRKATYTRSREGPVLTLADILYVAPHSFTSSNFVRACSNLMLKSHIALRISRKLADVRALSARPRAKMPLLRRYFMIRGSAMR
jgi:hypothetical protein